jgi:hypothetical protein
MFNNSYISVPFVLGLTYIGVYCAYTAGDYNRKKMFGSESFIACNLTADYCIKIRENDTIPLSRVAPLGISTATNQSEINCLARNITQEAVNGYIVDKIYVAWGTINRVKLGYGKTLCEVIASKNAMAWYKDPIKIKQPPLREDLILAKNVLAGYIKNPSPNCNITNWYNIKHDSKDSFNAKYLFKDGTCSIRPKNTPHFYMEVPLYANS